MNKITLTALALLMTASAFGQGRKTWDFRKGFSSSTINALQADLEQNNGANWTDYEMNQGEGTGKYYINTHKVVSGTAVTTVGGVETPIPELQGLYWDKIKMKGLIIAYNFSQAENENSPTGLYPAYKSFVWLNGKNLSFHFKAPQSVKLTMGIESHKSSEGRGVSVTVDGKALTPVSGNASSPKFLEESVFDLPAAADGTDSVTVYIKTNNGCHISYIIVGEGDPQVNITKKIGYVYDSSVKVDGADDPAVAFLEGASDKYSLTKVDVHNATITADSLEHFDAIVISSNIPANGAIVPVLKKVVAYEPIVNLNTKLYEAWGYGSEVTTTDLIATVTKPTDSFYKTAEEAGLDLSQGTVNMLNQGGITGVTLGQYFADDDTLATVTGGVAIHKHNPMRNAYILLPYSQTDLSNANQDNLSILLPAAVDNVAATKSDITKTMTPKISQVYGNLQTTVSIASQKGSDIYYTVDGTDPTEQSTKYTEPFVLTSPATVKAIAFHDGYLLSDIATATIDIKSQAQKPTITLNEEDGKTTVTLAQADGVNIYYNFTGSSKQAESQQYTAPIEMTRPGTISAFAIGGEFIQSELASEMVNIKGVTFANNRDSIYTHFDANKADWMAGESKARYLFTWGKSAQSQYSDPTDPASALVDYEVVVGENGQADWQIMSRGQVVTMEFTSFTNNVGDGNGYNPETVFDAMPQADSIKITSGDATLGAKVSGEPYNAVIRSVNKVQGPFDVVSYVANGNTSEEKLVIEVSADGNTWTQLGDTLKNNQERRLYRRYARSYEGTDQVYVRLAHVAGATKAMVSDIYVLGHANVLTGIANVNSDKSETKIVAVYSVNGARLATLQRGINIVKYSNGVVKKLILR